MKKLLVDEGSWRPAGGVYCAIPDPVADPELVIGGNASSLPFVPSPLTKHIQSESS